MVDKPGRKIGSVAFIGRTKPETEESGVDSIKSTDGYGMWFWKFMFGGDNLFGRLKLYIFLTFFILIGSSTLAQLA